MWSRIYQGNVGNIEQHIHNFTRKYAAHIFSAPAAVVQPMTGNGLKNSSQAASNSAAGLDNFAPEDLKHLSDLTYDWLAHLLNLVESGCAWPKDL